MTAKGGASAYAAAASHCHRLILQFLDWLNLWANGNDDSELCDNSGAIQNDLSLALALLGISYGG